MVRRPADGVPRMVCLDCGTLFRISGWMRLLGLNCRCPRCGSADISPVRF